MFILRKKATNHFFSKKIFFKFESYVVKRHDDVLRVLNISLDLYTRDIASKSYHLHKALGMNTLGAELKPTIYFVKGLNFT